MDKLAKQLKVDAQMIDVHLSDELDHRISSSLQGVTPERPEAPPVQQRPALFWWASSLTGIAAALAVIAIINSYSQPTVDPVPLVVDTSPVPESLTPTIDWKTESAIEELMANNTWFPYPRFWGVLIRFVAPVAIGAIILVTMWPQLFS